MPVDPFILGSAISAGSSIAGNIFNNNAIDRNNKAQIDLWNKTNEYNTPANQMKRFKDAGLNPHLIYGQGNSGNAGSAPASTPKSVDLTQFGSIVNTYLDLKQKDQQITNMQSENRGKEISNDINWFNLKDEQYKAGMDPANYKGTIRQKLIDLDLDNKRQAFKKIGSEINKNVISTDAQKFKLSMDKKMAFVPDEQRRRFDTYNILPDDAESIQFLKIAAKDVFGMSWEQFRQVFLNIIK